MNFSNILVRLKLLTISYAANIEDTPVQLSRNIEKSNNSSIIFFIGFIITALALIGIFMILRQKNIVSRESNKSVTVLDHIQLDSTGSLFIVKLRNKVHVLGKTEHNINLVETITDPDEIKILELDCKSSKEMQKFQQVLANQVNSVKVQKNNKSTRSNLNDDKQIEIMENTYTNVSLYDSIKNQFKEENERKQI